MYVYYIAYYRFFVNATLGSTLSSPLDSPDIMQRFIVANDIAAATTSLASIKLSSGESINTKLRQVGPIRSSVISHSSTRIPSYTSATTQSNFTPLSVTIFDGFNDKYIDNDNNHTISVLKPIQEYSSMMMTESNTIPNDLLPLSSSSTSNASANVGTSSHHKVAFTSHSTFNRTRDYFMQYSTKQSMLEFSISSVGRSFIDENEEINFETDERIACESLNTPDTPTPNISPTSSSNRISETFSNDFIRSCNSPNAQVSPLSDLANKQFSSTINHDRTSSCDGSWDFLELDLNFHEVNHDPSFGGDVEERIFFGDDPLGILPRKPTMPDSHDL